MPEHQPYSELRGDIETAQQPISQAPSGKKESSYRLLYAVSRLLLPPATLLRVLRKHYHLASLWGARAASCRIAETVRCNDPAKVKLAPGVSLEPYVELALQWNLEGKHAEASIALGADSSLMSFVTCWAFGAPIAIGERTQVGSHCHFGAYGVGIRIGANVLIASHCNMVDTQHVFADPETPIRDQAFTSKGIVIEDDVWLGAGVTVMDGVTIGRGAVIGAGAIVTKDVPPYAIAVGVPARVVNWRKPQAERA